MKRFITLSILTLALAACVDQTGLSSELSTPVHPLSSENAIVTVSEYADLQCPACRSAHSTLLIPLTQKYGTQIRYEFHHFPLSSLHRYAMDAAEAAECASDKGKFWPLVDKIYELQDQLTPEKLDEWGAELGVDEDYYSRCRASHVKRAAILQSYDTGKDLGVQGTPTFFVNGEQVEATIEKLSEAIDRGLNTGMAL